MRNGALLFIFVPFLIICQNVEARQKNTMPSAVLFLAKHFYPGWEIFQYSNLSNSSQNWSKDVPHPGWVKADFNGDAVNDYAVLLFKKIREDVKVKFVIFLSTATRKTLEPIVIMEEYYDTYLFSNMYLAFIPAGRLVRETMAGPDKKDRKQIILKLPAVEIVYVECSSVLYYWDKAKEKFEEIWTSD
ncbi:MAG: hypothetical protein QME32_00035 [Endomicrobiia bacterium]|nr:hypothetical protein [Endomicrobiia bacterium]